MNELNKIVDENLKKHIGASIKELNESLTSSLENRLSFSIPLLIKYKDAKHIFQKAYFTELLTLNHGNISKAAIIANLNRRQIHRICQELNIDSNEIRTNMLKPYNYLKQNVQDIIEEKVDSFKDVIHPDKIGKFYKNINEVSENITNQIDITLPTYDDAFQSFEENYFKGILNSVKNDISEAKTISGLSTRSILRKMKEFGIV